MFRPLLRQVAGALQSRSAEPEPGETTNSDGRGRGPFVGRQTWLDLLFAHWPVPVEGVRPLIPGELELDTYDGLAWVGVVPFRLEGLRPRGLPGIPGATDFLELNVRTYVRFGGRPGVWFFSLDASSRLAVEGARLLYSLPYFAARMESRKEATSVHYRSSRTDGDARFEARYEPAGEAFQAREGTLDHFVVERYRLFAVPRRGSMRRVEIEHPPWALRPAGAEIGVNTMAAAAGIALPDAPPLLHFVDRQDVLTGLPLPADGGASAP